jgi:hypothetical protein
MDAVATTTQANALCDQAKMQRPRLRLVVPSVMVHAFGALPAVSTQRHHASSLKKPCVSNSVKV